MHLDSAAAVDVRLTGEAEEACLAREGGAESGLGPLHQEEEGSLAARSSRQEEGA